MIEGKSNKSLSETFKPPSSKDWQAEVERLLKGAPYEKIMRTNTYEGFTIQPIYTKEDFKPPEDAEELPGFAPFTRGNTTNAFRTKSWMIAQEIRADSLTSFNRALKNDLNAGQNAIRLLLDKASRAGEDSDHARETDVFCEGVALSTLEDLEHKLEGIDIRQFPLQISAGASGIYAAAFLFAYCRKKQIPLQDLQITIEFDPLSQWAGDGHLPVSIERSMDEMALLTEWCARHQLSIKTIGIDTNTYHNAGASAVQEIGITLATGAFYLREMIQRGLTVNQVAPRIAASVGIGPHFFMEIAKLRSLRMLWNNMVEAFGGTGESRKLRIHGKTACWNKTKYDHHNNILRATTEAFAGILGSCESLHVGPFDETFRLPDEFSRRIARNIQLILRDESHCDRIIDPAGGAWYVESMTMKLAEEAWRMFQDIEGKGGIRSVLEDGSLQSSIGAISSERENNLSRRKDKLIGINIYARPDEVLSGETGGADSKAFDRRKEYLHQFRTSGDINKHLEPLAKLTQLLEVESGELMDAVIDAAFSSATIGEINTTLRSGTGGAPEIESLKKFRLAGTFEKLRQTVQSQTPVPSVFLAKMGPVSKHKARAEFSTSFFQVAGFTVVSDSAFETSQEAASAALNSGAGIIVICATDEDYPRIVPELSSLLRNQNKKMMIILAGYPKEHIERFTEAGIDEFIHIRSDVIQVLSRISKEIGVPV